MAKSTDNQSNLTTDHDTIRRWAEQRGGKPARVKGTGNDDDAGLLRIDMPGYAGAESLEPITWDEFFRKFDESELALVYQERTESGDVSHFSKLVSRDSAQDS